MSECYLSMQSLTKLVTLIEQSKIAIFCYNELLSCKILKLCINSLVPAPYLTLVPINPPRLNEQLTMRCNATSVRGIISRLDFTWTRIDDEREEIVQVVEEASRTGDSLVYIDTYTTPMVLNESDIGAVYICTISLNDAQENFVLDNFLNITLDTSISKYIYNCKNTSSCQ